MLLAFALIIPLSGCEGDKGAQSGTGSTDSASNETLSATSTSGGAAVDAPEETPYRASFGDFVLCAEGGRDPIEVVDVSFEIGEVEPVSINFFTRHVRPEDVKDSPVEGYAPFISALGGPPKFDESYAKYPGAGRFEPAVGTTIDEPCDEAQVSAGQAESGSRFSGSFTNLVVTLESTVSGADVKSFRIEYKVGGTRKSLKIPWHMIACGTAITQKDVCFDQ